MLAWEAISVCNSQIGLYSSFIYLNIGCILLLVGLKIIYITALNTIAIVDSV